MKTKMPTGDLVDNKTPQWKTPWNHDTEFESERTGLFCTDESLTKQEFKEETDINTILERFTRTGEPPPMPLPEHFTDITGRTNYFEMQSKIATANESFYTLPAGKRAEFQNDPTRWADAVVLAVDQGDRKALGDLGIEVPPEKPQAAPEGRTPPGGSPAPVSAQSPPEAPSKGNKPAGAPKD